jgi:ankyrin repeat protein
LAASTKNIRITDLLLTHYPKLNARNSAGATALIAAVEAGNNQVAATLIRNGADAGTKDKKHKTAIDYAKQANNIEIVGLLDGSANSSASQGK